MSLDMGSREEALHTFETKVRTAAEPLRKANGGETTIPCDSCKDAKIRVRVSKKAGTVMAQCQNFNDPLKRPHKGPGCGNPRLLIT